MDDALNSVARRTRSGWDSYYMNKYHQMRKNDEERNGVGENVEGLAPGDQGKVFCEKGGTFTTLTESSEESDYYSTDSAADGDGPYRAYVTNSKHRKVTSKGGGSWKKRGVGTEKHVDIDMLVDSIWKEHDLDCENLATFDEDKHMGKCVLPLRFRFGDDDDTSSLVVEKTERDKEIESLFNDMEVALWESEVGCADNVMEDADLPRHNDSPAANCKRGEHDTILDEEIGIVCRYCSTVVLEIKYVLPPFAVESRKRRYRDDYRGSESSFHNKIPVHGGNADSCFESTGTVLDFISDLDKELYPHQVEGFKFLWKNIAGDILIEKLSCNRGGGGGCIISHAPGTGKTRLTIVFLQTFMKLYPNCRPLIVAPKGMLVTWEQEFKKWTTDVNFLNLNENKLSCDESDAAGLGTKGNGSNTSFVRMVKLYLWMKGRSVLGISYQLFEELAGESSKKNCRNDKVKKMLLHLPGLVVMDEGHMPRNDQSFMWKALTKMATQRRVILSGTLFQNNFSELYNTLSLVNPRFCSEIMPASCAKTRGRKGKAKADEWTNLANSISQSDEEAINKLRCLMEPFVHVHKGDILEKTLKGMRDCLVLLKPTDLQSKLLQSINSADSFLEQVHLASLISVHPSLVSEKSDFSNHKEKLRLVELDHNAGVKTSFLIKLIQIADRLGEKVLVFSQFLDPLLHIKKLLKHHFEWHEGQEMTYIDGDIGLRERQRAINAFNDKGGKAKVMLASQRACSEGISLVGASRVVLLDVVWNPSVKRQAISRAYRLGQEKMIYVYHLVTLMEVNKYQRQAKKEKIASMIFDPEEPNAKCDDGDGGDVDKVLEAMVRHQGLGSMIENIIHQPKESDFVEVVN